MRISGLERAIKSEKVNNKETNRNKNIKVIEKTKDTVTFEVKEKLSNLLDPFYADSVDRDTLHDLFTKAEKILKVDRTKLKDEWGQAVNPEKMVKVIVTVTKEGVK